MKWLPPFIPKHLVKSSDKEVFRRTIWAYNCVLTLSSPRLMSGVAIPSTKARLRGPLGRVEGLGLAVSSRAGNIC